MDALAGYGSDSTSGNSKSSTEHAEENEEKNDSAALSGLLARYSDDEGEEAPFDSSAPTGRAEVKPSEKRQRLLAPRENVADAEKNLHLPPPRLSSSSSGGAEDGENAFRALVEFGTDYTGSRRSSSQHVSREADTKTSQGTVRKELVTKLDNLYATFYSSGSSPAGEKKHTGSFSAHLRSQKEFGNPSMFPSVVEHFGIDANGSNLSKKIWDPNGFKRFEFVDKISAAEEQARIRAAEEQS